MRPKGHRCVLTWRARTLWTRHKGANHFAHGFASLIEDRRMQIRSDVACENGMDETKGCKCFLTWLFLLSHMALQMMEDERVQIHSDVACENRLDEMKGVQK